jgi:serine/threonine protein kinase
MIMVFEIGGINLIDYYRSKGKIGLSESEIKVVAYQIALILEEMHRSNYMHRDLKPENILIDPKTSTIS